MMETESLSKFIIGDYFSFDLNKNLFFNFKISNKIDNPNLFLNPELSEEDKNILKNIFIYKERLLTEIKVIELFVLFLSYSK